MARTSKKKFNPWKSALSFMSGKSVTHEVCGKALTFYPASVRMCFKLQHMADPLSKAMTALFANNRQDVGTQVEQIEDQQGSVNRTTVEAVSPEIAKHRDDQRSGAVTQLLDVFMNPTSRILAGQIIMDSLRDNFEKDEVEDIPTVEEFLDGWEEVDDGEPVRRGGVDSVMFAQLVVGVVKANKEALGPLGLDALRKLQRRVKDEVTVPSSTDNTGPTSPTQSNSPSPEDTTSSGSENSPSTPSTSSSEPS